MNQTHFKMLPFQFEKMISYTHRVKFWFFLNVTYFCWNFIQKNIQKLVAYKILILSRTLKF